ncbi:MAG: phosphate acyltransferase PlsX, partial [Chloroflexota bacterium]|nr:phosphate acyltransferase PlsX [Chloroflexota bacterium]
GINLVREGKAAAFVSAGHSGAVFVAALLRLGKIVERPAIGTTIMIGAAPFLLIDAGANVDCRPNHLVQFARMGSIYARSILEIESPRVALLSNGEEASKGNRVAKQAHQMLKDSDLNFIGNIEGHDLPRGRADVVVTDGFTGNIVLKTLEGMGDTIQSLQIQLGQALNDAAHLPARLTSHILGMGTLAKRMDYKERGGACLLGVNGNIIFAHGRSQAKAMKNAIGLAKRTAEQDLVNIIKNGKL